MCRDMGASGEDAMDTERVGLSTPNAKRHCQLLLFYLYFFLITYKYGDGICRKL